MSHEKRSGGLRPWHVIVGIFVLLILMVVLWIFVEAKGAQAQLRALRDQGQPTSYAEWTERHQVPPGVDNAANLYQKAAAAYVKPIDDANTPLNRVKHSAEPPLGTPLPESMVRVTEQYLGDNEQALAMLREAGTIERSYYEVDASQILPPLADLRSCVRLLGAAAVLRANENDTADAVAYINDMINLAQSLRNQPTLISYLVRLASVGACMDVLQRALSSATFTDEQLVELDRMLSEIASSLDLAQAFSGERCGTIELINNPSGMDGGGGPMLIPGIKSVGLRDMLDYLGNCIEACELPPVERIARLKALSDEIENLSGLHIVAKMLSPALSRIAEIDLLSRTELDMARTALAIERYRLAKGQRPKDLGVLVPNYLDQVPIDPYGGQPIRYRLNEIGYILYSLGPGAQDDGGISKDEIRGDAPYDWPFVVAK